MTIEKILRNKMIFALLSIGLGIYLAIARQNALNSIFTVIGWTLVAGGVLYLLMYFFGQNKDQMMIYFGIGSAAGGVLLILLSPMLISAAPVLAGIVLILIGLINFSSVWANQEIPRYALIGPVLTAALGVVVIVNPQSSMSIAILLAGIALIINGVTELDLIRRIRN